MGMKEACSLDNLIDSHWQYVKGILETHGEEEYNIEAIGYHYKTAFKHGYKHAKEEQQESITNEDKSQINLEELKRRIEYPMRETRFGLVPDYSQNYKSTTTQDTVVYATLQGDDPT